MTNGTAETAVLWLTPDKPDDISVGRRRIAAHLSESRFSVTLRGTTPGTFLQSLRDGRHYDVVLGTTRAGAIAGALVKVATGTPLVVDHVDPIRQFAETKPRPLATLVRWLEAAAFRVADHVLYVYEEEEQRVRQVATATKTDLGVDFDRFANPTSDSIAQAEEAFKECDNVAIYVGGLEPIYHIHELLEAVSKLEGWTLFVLGTGSLSDLVDRAASTCDNIIYPGTISHGLVPGYLHAADVGVCLVDDPYTLKVLEYGAAGLPTVQVRGRAEDRLEGLVEFCDPDPTSIARAIERASGAESTCLKSFAQGYDWAEIAETYGRIITTVK